MNAAIAQHLNVTESAIVRVEEWANVLFAVVKGLGARFVSKKVVPMGAAYYEWNDENSDLIELPKESQASLSFKIDCKKLENWDGRIKCKDCGNWVWGRDAAYNRRIKHSSRCCSETAQPIETFKRVVPKPIKKSDNADLQKAAKDHKKRVCVDDETVFQAYKAGYLSMSDAMNRDF